MENVDGTETESKSGFSRARELLKERHMKSYNIARSDLTVSSVILGLMRIGEMADAEIRKIGRAHV